MYVTLDVSRLSGWLNADALCAESKSGIMKRSEAQQEVEGGGAMVAQAACAGEGPNWGLGAWHARSQRTKNM